MSKEKHGEEEGNGLVCPISKEWFQHRQEAKNAMEKIDTMHEKLSSISQHTQYLSKLEPISLNLESLAENNTKLIDVITGKKHIPASFGLALLILVCVLMVILVIKETKTDVKVGTDGISISGGGGTGR